MHEMSICRAIAETVNQHAAGRSVRAVQIKVGHFRQIVPDTLSFCWGLVGEASGLAGARLDVESVPATIRCHDCGSTTTLADPILICEACSSQNVELVSGREFLIESIELDEESS